MEWGWVSAILGALLSAGAAVYAARAATRAKASELEAVRLRELENRLSARKMEIYEEIMSTLGNMLIPEEARRQPTRTTSKSKSSGVDDMSPIFSFMNSVVVYGSDDVLRAFARFRASSNSNPPAPVLMRLVSDFMLAIRRDLDGGHSTVTGVELIGMRINELYEQAGVYQALTEPFEVVCAQNNWVPPWDEERMQALNSGARAVPGHAHTQ